MGITLTFIAATPEVRGDSSGDDPVALPAVTAPGWSPEFEFIDRLYAVDRVRGATDEELAPEGGIDEAEHAAAEAAPIAVATGGRFVLPLKSWSGVTDRFGAYRGPGFVHGGIDLDVANTARTPIYAACGGTVSYTGYSSTYGYHVTIDCGEGWSTLYGHMSAVYVTAGANAAIGETVLGTTGNTGFSMGEHLHFEILFNGSRVNPERYLDFGIAPGTPLSVGPPVYVSRPSSSGVNATSGGGGTGTESGSGATDSPATPPPAATRTPSPTAAPTKTPTPIPTPTLVPIPSHGSGLGECPRSDSGAVNCGQPPYAVVCAPTGWFLDYGGNFTNPRLWPVVWVNAVLDASGAC